ncbi:MarR family winged helix-turn-helix transcriptional regulator [Blastomonas sp. SL216]|uniref:MarR family winged helix-turn-helix transcriptional regulator n=1 Tax=Blastomonas sp. SL216 TaxID=2995169 RepID=UPI002376D484|nr:MarR family transcriptional regulator [Blastomonas sp. SL216]
MIDRQDSDSLFGLASMPGHLIRRSQQIATALFAEEVGELDLTPVQFAVLMVVVDRPRIEAARISDLIAFDRSTLADVLDRLARRKLIERTVSLTDKRAKAVVATPEGIALFERALPAVRRVQQRILEPLSTAERKAYVAMLTKLVGLHSAAPGDDDVPR